MRDIVVTVIIFGALPFVLKNPHIGILLWSWIGYMNPHRLAWGFAYSFPFAMIAGVVTIVAFFVSIKKLHFFWTPAMGWLLSFVVWMLVSTLFSLQFEDSLVELVRVIKIQLVIFMTLFIIKDRDKIHMLVWVIALSIGFYGIKGGVFTILSGGSAHVLGPGGFIEGNTEIGLVLVMVLPLFWYLYLNTTNKWARIGLVFSMLLIPVGILGTQSRGALLAIVAIGFFMWLKSRRKFAPFIVILMMVPMLYAFMPQTWHDRMDTMKDYENDISAMGRIQAWTFAYRLAVEKPLSGGGFGAFNPMNYERFSPGAVAEGTGMYHDSHSIYFEILGEQGFVGLGIFLMLGFFYWRIAGRIRRLTKTSIQHKWAYDLASMLQVSMVGYAVGGAFLGLAYFDLSYHFLAILIVVERIVEDSSTPNNQSVSSRDGMPENSGGWARASSSSL
ncbi:MAG: putative O-glycosylation ligase, exosortase A system-associated [Bacteroidetes bacterium]|nr:putative O-glycosylation ligase, exosortase A system-associated [Bacteroidota bacterium]